MAQKIILDKKQALNLTYIDPDDGDDEFIVIANTISGKRRWSVTYQIILKRISDETYWVSSYSRAATEGQYEQPWDYEDAEFTQVFPHEETHIVYK